MLDPLLLLKLGIHHLPFITLSFPLLLQIHRPLIPLHLLEFFTVPPHTHRQSLVAIL